MQLSSAFSVLYLSLSVLSSPVVLADDITTKVALQNLRGEVGRRKLQQAANDGACYVKDFCLDDVNEQQCVKKHDGIFQGTGTSCQDLGACYNSLGLCSSTTFAPCIKSGGEWGGIGNCPTSRMLQQAANDGACYAKDFCLDDVDEQQCVKQHNGKFQGTGTSCQDLGACYDSHGVCSSTTFAPCIKSGGKWAGIGNCPFA